MPDHKSHSQSILDDGMHENSRESKDQNYPEKSFVKVRPSSSVTPIKKNTLNKPKLSTINVTLYDDNIQDSKDLSQSALNRTLIENKEFQKFNASQSSIILND